MKVAMVSTFRTQCGVGIFCEELATELSKVSIIKVFAETLSPPQTETPPLDPFVNVDFERCWIRYQSYNILQQKILDFSPEVVHVQFVSGVFNELAYQENSEFQQFIYNLRKAGIKIVLTLHDIPERSPTTNPNQEKMEKWYRGLKAKFIIMNSEMSAILREWYPEASINLIPLGTPIFILTGMVEARKKLNLKPEDFLLTQIGFYGADKGMLDIVKAIPEISIPNFKLVFAGGFHPLASPIHRPYVGECIKSAIKLGVVPKIVFLNKILSEEEINLWASASNFLILNQQMIFGGSTSASAHRILCAAKPIIMSQSPKLSEFIHGIHCVKTYPDKISETINKLFNDKSLQDKLSIGASEYAKKTTFEIIAKKHMEIYEK